jgi:hypothetical protein
MEEDMAAGSMKVDNYVPDIVVMSFILIPGQHQK